MLKLFCLFNIRINLIVKTDHPLKCNTRVDLNKSWHSLRRIHFVLPINVNFNLKSKNNVHFNLFHILFGNNNLHSILFFYLFCFIKLKHIFLDVIYSYIQKLESRTQLDVINSFKLDSFPNGVYSQNVQYIDNFVWFRVVMYVWSRKFQ